jgi:hypothetical protein
VAGGAVRRVRRAPRAQITVGAVVLLASATAHEALASVGVKPRGGTARTVFDVSFKAPIDTRFDPFNESYAIVVKGAAEGACSEAYSVWDSSGRGIRQGQVVRANFNSPYAPGSARGHGRWCKGRYAGTITETSVNPSSSCEQTAAPPGCATVTTNVGTFRFKVS